MTNLQRLLRKQHLSTLLFVACLIPFTKSQNEFTSTMRYEDDGDNRISSENSSIKENNLDFETIVLGSNTEIKYSDSFWKDAYPTLVMPAFRPVFTSIEQEGRNVYHNVFNESHLLKWQAFQIQLYAEIQDLPKNITASMEDDYFHPLVVTAKWQGEIKSWKIPVVYINDTMDRNVQRYSDNTVGKTIWQYHPKGKSFNSPEITVEVTSFTGAKVYYKYRTIILKDFIVLPESSITGTATPASPTFYKFDIPEAWEYVFIHAVSDSDVCAMMTVEYPRGPFLDMEDNNLQQVKFSETFTMKTGMTIKAEDFTDGFLLAFTPFPNNERCKKAVSGVNKTETGDNFRKKQITFQIRQGKSPVKYVHPTFFPLLLFILITFAVLILMIVFHNIRHNTISKSDNAIIQRCLYQFTSNITITDLIVTEPSRVVDQSRRYCTAGFVTSAFYSVPVFQLILTFSRQLTETGNFDLCYFNHFCSHMLGMFHDFNHMYSNVWYVLFGFLYMGMVRIRQLTFDPNYTNNQESNTAGKNKVFIFFQRADGSLDRGVMTHYGLLYCMGYALIMTGVMSAAYHICPNQRNFQFDTVFMYTIAAITVVTLYQARHPTYLSANFTFTALALVTISTVLGLLWEEFFIRVIFSAVHMLFLLLSLPKVFYSGYIRKGDHLVIDWLEVMRILYIKLKDDCKKGRMLKIQREVWFDPNSPDTVIIPGPGRAILPGFLLFINCFAITCMWTFLIEQNFATQVLFICVINGALYTVFYSALKLFHGECRRVLWIQPFVYLVASFALWGTAMTFFFNEVSTWESSPAESRLKNTDCIVLSFYDSHDMWHFLSAAALFFSAMVLLTVDDDLVDQPKSTIPVF